MIKFRYSRVDRTQNNTPIVSDAEIDQYAHAVLEDYKLELLQKPGKIRFEHFLESYLGVTLEFKDIYNDDPGHPILGATAFNHERLRIFNRERMCVSGVDVDPMTVIIDNSVMEPGKEGLALFTGLHEGGHVLMHGDVYTHSECENQIGLFEDKHLSPIVCCRRENIESYGRRRFRNGAEWREHHADHFASAVAMPNVTFKPEVLQMLRENGVWKLPIVLGKDEDLDILAEYLLPERIAEIFGVSKRAAYIKLLKTGFVIERNGYAQLAF